jgi:hypothetical protein
MTPLPIKENPRFFRPRSFLAGLLAGVVAMSWLGWRVSRLDYHPGFTRFHPEIAPEGSYYPTIAEMGAIVRARCRPDQVLVIVGGNSIFFGVGQPAAEMWTGRLQELLGDRYCVVNLAFRGAWSTDGAALVAEALRDEFPRQIYVANVGYFQGVPPLGSDPYQFLFWDAYFKGRLLSYGPRTRFFWDNVRGGAALRASLPDVAGRVWLDRLLHFHDFWNYVTMRRVNTVPSFYHPNLPAALWPRQAFPDEEVDTSTVPLTDRFRASNLNLELEILRGFSASHYERAANGAWKLIDRERAEMVNLISIAVPGPLRGRTLMVVSKSCPYYEDRLTPDERQRDEAAIRDSLEIWRAAGYRAATYPDDLTADDYGDRAHLTAAGGRKLAVTVADQVQRIAQERGYLSSAPSKP